jgi:HK97 family phage major capsid protein
MSQDSHDKILDIVEAIRTEAQTRDGVHLEAQKRMRAEFAELTRKADDALNEARKVAAVEAALTAIETRLSRRDLAPGDERRSEHQAALADYLVRGQGKENVPTQYRAANEGTDAAGGFLVTPELDTAIAGLARDMNPIRSVATVRTGTAPAIRLVRQTSSKGAAGWVSEAAARSETGTPQLGTTDIVAHELYAAPRATQTILEDAVQIEAWLVGEVNELFNEYELDAHTNGNGIGKPKGLFTYTGAAQTGKTEVADGKVGYQVTGVAGDFGLDPYDNLIDLVALLHPAYLPRAGFMMDRITQSKLVKVKDSNGNYIYQPSLTAGVPSTILGYGVTLNDLAPSVAANAYAIAFGDFSAYHVYDRRGTTLLRDPYTAKPYVEFYTTKRVGGGLHRTEKVKYLRFGTA